MALDERYPRLEDIFRWIAFCTKQDFKGLASGCGIGYDDLLQQCKRNGDPRLGKTARMIRFMFGHKWEHPHATPPIEEVITLLARKLDCRPERILPFLGVRKSSSLTSLHNRYLLILAIFAYMKFPFRSKVSSLNLVHWSCKMKAHNISFNEELRFILPRNPLDLFPPSDHRPIEVESDVIEVKKKGMGLKDLRL